MNAKINLGLNVDCAYYTAGSTMVFPHKPQNKHDKYANKYYGTAVISWCSLIKVSSVSERQSINTCACALFFCHDEMQVSFKYQAIVGQRYL